MSSDTSSTTQQPENPLANVSPNTVEELFSKDPMDYTQQDIKDIVGTLRLHREKFLAEEVIAATKEKKPRGKKEPSKENLQQAKDLNDLLNMI